MNKLVLLFFPILISMLYMEVSAKQDDAEEEVASEKELEEDEDVTEEG